MGRGNLTILEVDIQGKKLEGLKAIFDGGYYFKDTYDISQGNHGPGVTFLLVFLVSSLPLKLSQSRPKRKAMIYWIDLGSGAGSRRLPIITLGFRLVCSSSTPYATSTDMRWEICSLDMCHP